MAFNQHRTLDVTDVEAGHGATVSRSLKTLHRFKAGTLLTLLLMATITLVSTTIYPAIQRNVLPLEVVLGMAATTTVLFVIWLILFFVERKKRRHAKLHTRYYYEHPSPPARNIPGGSASSRPRPSISPPDETLQAIAAERAVACWRFLCNSAGSLKNVYFGGGGGGFVPERRTGSTPRPIVGRAGIVLHHQARDVGSQIPPAYPYYRLEENTAHARAEATINRTSEDGGSQESHDLHSAYAKDLGDMHSIPKNPADQSVSAAAEPQARNLRVAAKASNRAYHIPPQDLASSSLEMRSILEPPSVKPPFPGGSFDRVQRRGSRTPTQENHPKVVPPVRPRTAGEHGTSYNEHHPRMQQSVDPQSGFPLRAPHPIQRSVLTLEGNQRLKSGAEGFGYHHGYGGK